MLKAIRDGGKPADIMPELDEDVSFYILGMAPNAARVSIRFWQETNLGDLLEKVGRHYRELNIVRKFDREKEFPPLRQLLLHTANLKGIKPTDSWDTRNKRISPIIVGGLTRAMLTGAPYPQNLLSVVLDRIRAEHNVTYFRAALLKAYLLRNKRMEVPVALDMNRKDRPYLLGRLFAVLEKAQEEAIPGANATVKDRYLAAAAATPGRIFGMLLINSENHITKLKKDQEKKNLAFYYKTMIQDITAAYTDLPKTMKAEDQGMFMIGYYHQRKDFFTKKTQEG